MNVYELEKQATPGPMHVYELKYAENSKPHDAQIRDKNHDIIMVPAKYGEHSGAPLNRDCKIANAKLFTHCRNNFMKALETLKQVAETTRSGHGECIEWLDSVIKELETIT